MFPPPIKKITDRNNIKKNRIKIVRFKGLNLNVNTISIALNNKKKADKKWTRFLNEILLKNESFSLIMWEASSPWIIDNCKNENSSPSSELKRKSLEIKLIKKSIPKKINTSLGLKEIFLNKKLYFKEEIWPKHKWNIIIVRVTNNWLIKFPPVFEP